MFCQFCKKSEAVSHCSKCLNAVYCGKSCQKMDWSAHKLICNDVLTQTRRTFKPTASSDRLPDWLPSEQQFDRAKKNPERMAILAETVLAGLMDHKGASPENIKAVLDTKNQWLANWPNVTISQVKEFELKIALATKTQPRDPSSPEEYAEILIQQIVDQSEFGDYVDNEEIDPEQIMTREDYEEILMSDEFKFTLLAGKDDDDDSVMDDLTPYEKKAYKNDLHNVTYPENNLTPEQIQRNRMLVRASYRNLALLNKPEKSANMEFPKGKRGKDQMKEHISAFRELLDTIRSATSSISSIIKRIYNGVLSVLFFGNVLPDESEQVHVMQSGQSVRKYLKYVLSVAVLVITTYFGYTKLHTGFDEASGVKEKLENIGDLVLKTADKQLTTMKVIQDLKKKHQELGEYLITTKETVEKAQTGLQYILNGTAAESGAFLIADTVSTAIDSVDGPLAYAQNLSKFFGNAFSTLRQAYLQKYNGDPSKFSQVAEASLNRWKVIQDMIDKGTPLDNPELKNNLEDLMISIQTENSLVYPVYKRFIDWLRERLEFMIHKHETCSEDIKNIDLQIADQHNTLIAVAMDSIATKINGAQYPAVAWCQRMSEAFLSPSSTVLTQVVNTLKDPQIQATVAENIGLEGILGKATAHSFSLFWAFMCSGGGFHAMELMVGFTAAIANGIERFFTKIALWLANSYLDEDQEQLQETTKLIMDGVIRFKSCTSQVGYLLCKTLAVSARGVKYTTGVATNFFRQIREAGTYNALYGAIIGFGLLVLKEIGKHKFPREWVASLLGIDALGVLTTDIGLGGAYIVLMLFYVFSNAISKLTPSTLLKYSEYRRSLPKNYYMDRVFGGEKDFTWKEKVGLGFGIAGGLMFSKNLWNTFFSVAQTEYAASLVYAAQGVTKKQFGQ